MDKNSIFFAEFPIKAITWKRTIGGRRINPRLQSYYYDLYTRFLEADLRPLDNHREYGIEIVARFTDRRWRDSDNILKGILDSGQPSKWAHKADKPVLQDFWDDRVFSVIHFFRDRGSYKDAIEIEIWEVGHGEREAEEKDQGVL